MKVEFDVSLDELGRIVSLLKRWRKVSALPGWFLTDHERDLARKGQKIEAIKSLRNRSGLGLKESKDIVEAQS